MPTVVCNGKVVELDRTPIAIPTCCPSCAGPITRRQLTRKVKGTDVSLGRIFECTNSSCPARITALLKSWINKLNILDIGDGLLEAMVRDLGVSTPADLYRLTVPELARLTVGVGKLGVKRAEKVVRNIAATRQLPLHLFLGSLGVPHLGRRRVQLIMQAAPGKLDTLQDWRGGKLLWEAAAANVPNIAAEIQKGIDGMGPVIDALLRFITIVAVPKKEAPRVSTGKLSGRVMCFTGKIEKTGDDGKRYTRERMQQLVLDAGGQVVDDIRKGTTDLVQADVNSTSSKSVKAKKLGVNLLSEEDFFKLVGVD